MNPASRTWFVHTTLCFHILWGWAGSAAGFFLHTAERLANRRKEPKSKIRTWIKARLNFALIWSMLLYLWGTRTPSNVDNISEINLCAIVTKRNIEWITYRFIPCYFMILICMVTYLFVLFLEMYFVFIPSKQIIWDLILYLKELMVNLTTVVRSWCCLGKLFP